MRAHWALLGGLALLLRTPRDASACSIDITAVEGCPALGGARQATLPSNAIFPARCGDSGAGQCSIEWSADARSTVVCDRVEVPFPGSYCVLRAPVPRMLTARSSPSAPYASTITFGAVDTSPPAMPTMTFEINLVRDPSSGGAFGCPDVDMVVVNLRASEPGPAYAVYFFGATPEEVAAATRAEAVTSVCANAGSAGFTVTASAGTGEGRYRPSLGGFTRRGRYCFAAAMMDVAGNIGPRTDAQCLNTQDESDPHVVFVDPKDRVGCLCRVGAPRGALRGPGLVGVALAGLVVHRARRKRRA